MGADPAGSRGDPVPVPGGVLSDPDLPGASVLLGSEAAQAVSALAAEGGAGLVGMRPRHVVYHPGRRLTVMYAAQLRRGNEEPEDRAVVLHTSPVLPEGATVLGDGGVAIAGWVFPHDPLLVGLPVLFDAERRQALLAEVGITGDVSGVVVRSYRPGRRAVVELTAGEQRVFVKAVRSGMAAELQSSHRHLAATVPVPRSLGWSDDHELVVLEPLNGVTLLSSLAESTLSAGSIIALLDRFPPGPRRIGSPVDRIDHHKRMAGLLLPHRAEALERVAEALSHVSEEPLAPVHGDLHSGQLMVEADRITGVVDVDSAGMGCRLDDVANLIAHLFVVAMSDRAAAELGGRLLAEFEAVYSPRPLRLRVAAALLGYASGPWLSQRLDWPTEVGGRLDAVAEWVDSGLAVGT